MADISKINVNNTTYNLKDASALTSLSFAGHTLTALQRNGTSSLIDMSVFDSLDVTDLNAGSLIVRGSARFVNGLYGNLTGDVIGNATSATTAQSATTAASATKATQDSDGNPINSTYLKNTGGTVSGTLILSKATDLSGTANNSPALIVGGAATSAHIEVDADEIQAKTNGTSTAALYLNKDGGKIYLGSNVEVNGATITATTFSGNATSATTATTATTASRVAGTAGVSNAYRNVWFSDSAVETVRNSDTDFQYNPALNILKVGSVTGNLNGKVALDSRTYSGIYVTDASAASNVNFTNGTFYFGTVKPTDWYVTWHVKYRIYASVPNQNNYRGYFEVNFYGAQSTRLSYSNYNSHYSYSDRTLYYHVLYSLTQTGFNNGYGHLLGIGLRNSNNPHDSNYQRTFTIEIIEADNCTVSMNDNMLLGSNVPGTGSTNYNGYAEWEGYTNGLCETNDANDTQVIQKAATRFRAGANGIHPASIFMQDANGTWQSLTLTSGAATTKEKNPVGFRLGQIYYTTLSTATGTITSGNILPSSGVRKDTPTIDFRYSSNCGTTLTAQKPVYLVGKLINGLFYLSDEIYTQDEPTTADGNLYIYLGYAASTYTFDFSGWLGAYYHNGTNFLPYEESAITSITANNGTFTATRIDGTTTTFSQSTDIDTATIDDLTVDDLTVTGDASFAGSITGIDSTKIEPIASKTYTGLIGTASNTAAEDSFYFMTLRPDDYYGQWRVRYKVTMTVPGHNEYRQSSDVTLYGVGQATAPIQSIFNWYYVYSARPYWYHNFYRLTQTGYNAGLSNAIGIGLRSSYARTTAGYERTITIELLEQDNCECSFLVDAIKWANWTNGTTTNYAGLTEFNGCDAGLQEAGDVNNYDRRRFESVALTAGTYGIYGYTYVMEDADGRWQSLVKEYGYNVTHTRNTSGFRPDKIFYYSSTTTVANGATTGTNAFYEVCSYNDFRYNSNCETTLVNRKPVYLVGTITNGLFYLADNWYTQTLPTTADNKYYMYLGEAVSNYQIALTIFHPIYYFDGYIKEWHSSDPYEFTSGTNSFTYKPRGASSAKTVTITPSITNNITGSGTNGYLAKFTGANTISSGPQLGSGTTTYLRNDGQWATPTDTWNAMVGATASANGSVGYVNAIPPKDGYNTKYLRADGTWSVPPDNNTWNPMVGATASANGSVGYVNTVPPKDGYNTKYLRADGLWMVPPDTWTAMVGATSSANGSVGYINAVPPKDGYNTKFLRADGTWSVPGHNTAYLYTGTSTGTANATTTNGNTHLILMDGGSARTRTKITGSGATSVTSNDSNVITINSINTTYTPTTKSIGYVTAWSAGTLPALTISSVPCDDITSWSDGDLPSLTITSVACDDITNWSDGTLPTLTISSVTCDDITDWSDGTLPSLTVTPMDCDDITEWNAGTLPSLTLTDVPCDDITAWSAGTVTSASVSGGTLTITIGTKPSLSYTPKTVGSASGWAAGSKPSLSYTARSVGSASNWSAGAKPSLTYTPRSVGSASGWSAGTKPALTYTPRSVGSASDWDEGSKPTLAYTAKSVGSASGWGAGTLPSLTWTNNQTVVTDITAD